MNTVGPALHSATAVAGTGRTRQPSTQSNATASWDATYDDARAAGDKDPPSRLPQSASGTATAKGVDGKPAKTGSASDQPGDPRSNCVIGNGIDRQGTPATKDDKIAGSAPPAAVGDGTALGDPTAGASPADPPSAGTTTPGNPTAVDQSSTAGQPAGPSTSASDGKPTNDVTRATIGEGSKPSGNADDVRVDQDNGTDRCAESDNTADQNASADGRVASGSAKPGQSDTPAQLQTDKTASRAGQTRHVSPDAAANNMPSISVDSQLALSQWALAANPPIGADQATKSDDRDSIVLAAGTISGTAASALPLPQNVHGAAGAQDPEPPAQELLHNTAVNLVTDGGGTARIVLTPPTLGHVEVSVTMAPSGAAHIAITAATAAGYAALTASHAGLLQHLAQRGVSVGSVQTQLQGNAGQNGTSSGDGRQRHNQPTPAVPWVKKGQDGTVIAYA